MTSRRPAALDLEQLRAVFVQECEDGLCRMEEALVALEQRPDDSEALGAIFRVAHTIKGGAAMTDFPRVAEYAHLLEDALDMIRDGSLAVNASQITLLLQAVDALRNLVAAESAGRTIQIRAADRAIIQRLIAHGSDEAAGAETAEHDDTASALPAFGHTRQSLRVDMDQLDALLTLSGEIAVGKGRLQQAITRSDAEGVATAAEELTRSLGDLQERVMRLRLVPLGPLFRHHIRAVRDIAAAQGKLVELRIEGEDVELDASIVQQLREPLLHAVRNAVDHGIEHAAQRTRAGKHPSGTVVLAARHERGAVRIEIRDDGAGLRRDRILDVARKRGLVSDNVILTDAEVHALVFREGFSTADHVTELSGRGVGMDVVRRSVEQLRGSLRIETAEGQGTTLIMDLPLTVAIIDGFVVGVGDERYVIPVESVTECLAMPDEQHAAANSRGVLSLRGDPLPWVHMGGLFGGSTESRGRRQVVVVQHADRRAGLVVDQLFGEQQAVLKPLDALFDGVAGISGSTILGDGRVSLIIDVPRLLALTTTPTAAHAHANTLPPLP